MSHRPRDLSCHSKCLAVGVDSLIFVECFIIPCGTAAALRKVA